MKRLIALIFSLGMTASANAIVMVYDNDIDYTSAVGTELFLIDFNSSPGTWVDGSTIDSNAVFSSPEASNPNQVVWNSDAITDAGSTTADNNVGPIAIDFINSGIFGFSFISSSSGEFQTIELFDNSDLLIASVLSPSNSGFFGFVSDIAISSAKILPGAYGVGLYDRFFIDDLRANNANSVPVPPTLLLLILGLAALRVANWKNKQA